MRYKPKHLKKDPKEKNRKIRMVLLTELLLLLAACYGIFYSSWNNLLMRYVADAGSVISEIKSEKLSSMAKDAIKTSRESIIEEVDEYVWTKQELSYRTGPDESYPAAGTLEVDNLVNRTGHTKNEWSQVSIDEATYYIASNELTDETPLSALIEPGQKGEYQKYALSLFPDYGWSDKELEPLINLWNRESHWNPNSHNGGSGAHGIPQALPASKMASEGSDYYTNGETQIRWGLKYISGRYGSPSNAWSSFQSKGWY